MKQYTKQHDMSNNKNGSKYYFTQSVKYIGD